MIGLHQRFAHRRRITLLLLILLIGCLATAAGADDGPRAAAPRMRGCGKAEAAARIIAAEEMRAEWQREYERMLTAGEREALTATDVLHADLEVDVRPGLADNLYGTCTLTIESRIDGLTTFTFRLRNQYVIDSAVVNGGTAVAVTTPSTTTRVATLDRAYNTGEVFTLTIAYHGHAESRGFGSIEFTTHSGSNIVYTLSEPYYAYTWWPAKDGDVGEAGDNADKFTLDLAVIAPTGMVTASNGTLQGVDSLSGSRQRYRWASDYPISTYLVCFSSTNYNTYTYNYAPLAGGTMDVLLYLYPEDDTTTNRNAWAQCVPMLTAFRSVFGEFPFVNEKYGIYECEFGGGMEHQTFTAQGTFSEWVTAHELGHSWWGDMITCKTWNHIWLNEGFASYSEALWEERKPGSSGLPALKAYMNGQRYTGAGSVYVTDAELGDLYAIFDGSTSYDKGSWVVHMLRHVLGDDGFVTALAAYRAAFEGSGAVTEDLQAICEAVYGSSLEWFFDEWIYGERTPSYAFGWQSLLVAGNRYLALYIDQTQNAAYQRFKMPIDIVVNGTRYVVFNDRDPEHFVIPLPAAATTVQLDPDAWILTSGVSSTAYVPGPPKIVVTSPAPGGAVDLANAVSVTFHTPVSTNVGHYTLVGDAAGPQPVSFSYQIADNRAVLTAASLLPADTYTLTISDSLTANNSGQQLDGEMADPSDPASLPSGEGAPGGVAQIRFTVTCGGGDADCDGDVDLFDYAKFQACYTDSGGVASAGCNMMAIDADQDVDLDDYELFAGLLGI